MRLITTELRADESRRECEPPNWVYNRWFRHRHVFRHGPFRCLRTGFKVRPDGDGSHVEYTIELEPANSYGRLLGAYLLRRVRRKSTRLVLDAEAFCEGLRDTEYDLNPPKLAAGTLVRTRQIADRINSTDYGHDLGHDLAHYVLDSPCADVATIRPLMLAKHWDVPERLALEVCLQAVVEGLLVSRWEILCMRCRAAVMAVPGLRFLPHSAHCPNCDIDCGLDLSQNVELVFSPATTIRTIELEKPHVSGPMSTPHIIAQITVPAGEQQVEPIRLQPDTSYCFRTLEPGGDCRIDYRGGSFPELIAEPGAVLTGAPVSVGMVAFINRGSDPLTFILEEAAWRDDRLTIVRASSLQAFHDLFRDEVPPAGPSFLVEALSYMTTGLKDFAAVYKRLGDLRAYDLAKEHCGAIYDAVRENDGSIVRNNGDAVMAVFHHPADALRCAIRVQHDMCWYNRTAPECEVVVKIGLHTGRCILVSVDHRLEYFGSAINVCAGLKDLSHGGDIVMSEEFARDAAVTSIVKRYSPEREEIASQGIGDALPIWRISAKQFSGILPNVEQSSLR